MTDIVYLDIETNLKHDTIWMCATKKNGVMKIWYDSEGLQQYLDGCEVYAHNGVGFDYPVLRKVWGVVIEEQYQRDTLVLSRLHDPDIAFVKTPEPEEGVVKKTKSYGPHSLGAWGIRLGMYKGDFDDFDSGWSQEMEDYCANDVELLKILHNHLTQVLTADGFSQRSIDIEHEVAIICQRMHENGYQLNEQKAQILLAQLSGRMADIEHQLQSVFPPTVTTTKTPQYYQVVTPDNTLIRTDTKGGVRDEVRRLGYPLKLANEAVAGPLKQRSEPFNPGSRQQIAERLIGAGVKLTVMTDKGNYTIDEDVLDGIDVPEAKLVSEYLMVQKRIAQVSSWLEMMDDNGRVHGSIITNGAVTGRATHNSPNMGQIPSTSKPYGAECREMWEVPKGMKQVGVDLSGIELRCLSHYMQDEEWQKVLLSGDIHWLNAKAMGVAGKDEVYDEHDKELKAKRNKTKTLTYGVLYGAGPQRAADIFGCSKARGKTIINNFIDNTPALKKLKEKIGKIYKKSGALPGLDGRKLRVRSEHAALNVLLQSAGAIIAKQWLIEITKSLKEREIYVKLLAWVHDEVQIEVREEDAELVAALVIEAAKTAGEAFSFRCPVDAESHIGNNWKDCH